MSNDASPCGDMMHLLRKYDVASLRSAISHPNHAKGVYIINSKGIAYHQHKVLYIIKPQVDARWRVLRYKGGAPPLMISTTAS